MHLGTLIRRLANEEDAALALEAVGDVVLFAEVTRMGEHFDETPAAYVAAAASRFANLAGNEDWLALRDKLERTDDAARSVMKHMLRWALARDAHEMLAHA